MVSLSCNSLAMRSSPQVGFSAAISRMSLRRWLGICGLPTGRDFQRQKRRNPLRCQRREVSGLDVHQGAAPREHGPQNDHNQPRGIVGAVWLDLALLEQGELFAEEEVFGSQCAARPGNEQEETNEIARDR